MNLTFTTYSGLPEIGLLILQLYRSECYQGGNQDFTEVNTTVKCASPPYPVHIIII